MLAQAARLGMLEHDFPEHRLSRSGAIPVIGNWELNFPFGSFCAVAKRQLREVLRGIGMGRCLKIMRQILNSWIAP